MNDKDATLAFFQTKIVKDQTQLSCNQPGCTGHILPALFSTADLQANA
jgi:hypothetical protein